MKAATNFKQTSFHHTTIVATPQELIDLAESLGAEYHENNTGEDKTNFDFDFETDTGIYFTVYDWKEYRALDLNKVAIWHIGGETEYNTREAVVELAKALTN